MAERLPISVEVSQVTPPISAQSRPVSVEEARIASASIDLLYALIGAARVEPLGDVIGRTLTPTANRLAAELRAAGYQLGPEGHA